MTHEAFRTRPTKNFGLGSHVIEAHDTEMFTVSAPPAFKVLISAGAYPRLRFQPSRREP